MRTLLLGPEMFAADGGIARILRLYRQALGEAVHEDDGVVSLVLNDPVDSTAPESDTNSNSPRSPTRLGCGRSKVRFVAQCLAQARRCDRIVCGHLHQLPVAWLAHQLNPSVDYFLVAHGIEVWRPFSFLETLALRRARGIFCVSDYTRRQLRRFCPDLKPERLHLVPNASDPYFALTAVLSPRRTSIGPNLLAVSRLTSADNYKGVDTLIEALPLVRRIHPQISLRIVGDGDDASRLQALVARLGLGDHVAFCGRLSDEALRDEYAACDLFALPSRREGFGLVYLEAMAHGKPCLGARAGGAPEVITPDTGVLAEYANIPDIAAAVLDLVRHPRDPAALRAHVAAFGYDAFRARLRAALAA